MTMMMMINKQRYNSKYVYFATSVLSYSIKIQLFSCYKSFLLLYSIENK